MVRRRAEKSPFSLTAICTLACLFLASFGWSCWLDSERICVVLVTAKRSSWLFFSLMAHSLSEHLVILPTSVRLPLLPPGKERCVFAPAGSVLVCQVLPLFLCLAAYAQ